MGIEEFDQLGEVGKRPGQPVHLVDDDDVRVPDRPSRGERRTAVTSIA